MGRLYRSVTKIVLVAVTRVASLAVAVAASPAWAQGADAEPVPLRLVQPEALPFSDAEIQGALQARLPPAGESGEARLPRVEIEPGGAGLVTVHVSSRSRIVPVGERSGADAARVVALVIAELMSAGAEATGEADTPAAPSVTVNGSPVAPPPTVDQTVEPPGQATPRALRLSLTGGAAKGTGTDDVEPVAWTLDADVMLPLGDGPLRFAPSAGFMGKTRTSVGTQTLDDVSFMSLAARALAGRSVGSVDLLAGPLVTPYRIGGLVHDTGVLFGAEAMVRFLLPISSRLRPILAARADVFGNRTRVHFLDGTTYATPRLQIGLAIGLAWDTAAP